MLTKAKLHSYPPHTSVSRTCHNQSNRKTLILVQRLEKTHMHSTNENPFSLLKTTIQQTCTSCKNQQTSECNSLQPDLTKSREQFLGINQLFKWLNQRTKIGTQVWIALFKIILEFDSTENILLVSTTNTSSFQSQVRCTHLDQGRRKRIRYVYERSTQWVHENFHKQGMPSVTISTS